MSEDSELLTKIDKNLALTQQDIGHIKTSVQEQKEDLKEHIEYELPWMKEMEEKVSICPKDGVIDDALKEVFEQGKTLRILVTEKKWNEKALKAGLAVALFIIAVLGVWISIKGIEKGKVSVSNMDEDITYNTGSEVAER